MSQQSLANQLGWVITTKDNLNELSGTMNNFSNHYAEQVKMLDSRNYFDEALNDIKKMSLEFDEYTKDIVQHIEQSHLAYIEVQSKVIRNELSQYK